MAQWGPLEEHSEDDDDQLDPTLTEGDVKKGRSRPSGQDMSTMTVGDGKRDELERSKRRLKRREERRRRQLLMSQPLRRASQRARVNLDCK